MARQAFQAYITNPNDGGVLDGAQLSVTYEAGGTATIYEQQEGGAEKDNPFTVGSDGKAVFYAEPGLYRITATQGGITSEFRNFRIGVYSNELSDITSIADLNPAALVDGQQFYMTEYRAGTGKGGGPFEWDSSRSKADHDGALVVDPGATPPSDWTNETQVRAWFDHSGAGAGCLVRVIEDNYIDAYMFGVVKDNYATNQYWQLRQLIGSRQGSDTVPTFLGSIPQGARVFCPGGIRAEVGSEIRLRTSCTFTSDGDPVRLPFTQAFADLNPNTAFNVDGADIVFNNVNLNGFRKTNGVGTSPDVSLVGQGCLFAISLNAANLTFNDCFFNDAVHNNIIYSTASNVKFNGGGAYGAGEHTVYMGGGGDVVEFNNFVFGPASRNNGDVAGRTGFMMKIRADLGIDPTNIKIRNCKLIGDTPATNSGGAPYTHGGVTGVEGLANFEIDGLAIENSDDITSVFQMAPNAGGAMENVTIKNVTSDSQISVNSTLGIGNIPAGQTLDVKGMRLENFVADTVTIYGASLFSEISDVYCKNIIIRSHAADGSRSDINVKAFNIGQKTAFRKIVVEGDSGAPTTTSNGIRLFLDIDEYNFEDCVFNDTSSSAAMFCLIGQQDFVGLSDKTKVTFVGSRISPESSGNSLGFTSFSGQVYDVTLRDSYCSQEMRALTTDTTNLYLENTDIDQPSLDRAVRDEDRLFSFVANECSDNMTLAGKATITAGNTSASIPFPDANKRGFEPLIDDGVLLTPLTDTAGKSYWFVALASSYEISIDSTHTSDITFNYKIQPNRR